jgi:filamentous hemagglutinin
LTTTGSFTVNGSFSQANGSIVAAGPASITQNTGSLNIANLEAAGISVQALNGAVTQSGAWKSGAVSVDSAAGAILTNAGNRISSFRATSSGAGNVELVNTGVLNVLGITTPSGNIVISNTGGVTTTGVVSTGSGSITGTANSPLTIGPDGLFATGDIVLTATNRTSAGNLTLLGNVSTSGGAVNLDAGQDFVQNGSVFGALGVAAAIGGSASFGPDALTKGFPVRYVAGGVPVIPPGAGVQPGVTTGAGGNAPTDFVLTFLTKFDQALDQQIASNDTPGEKKKDANGVVVEGQTCVR